MAKKKATMTLKDFHGGSIPSDLPLPSAPGVIVRPVDRGGFDRQTSWGSSMGRSEHRLRPASSGSVRNFDDKSPFLTHKEHIGSHFDEDERKPLDAVSGPCRIASDEVTRSLPNRLAEPRMDYLSGARTGSQLGSAPLSQFSSGSTGSSYAGRLTEVHNVGLKNQSSSSTNGSVGVHYQNVGGNAGQVVSGSYQNAWGLRKEATCQVEPVSVAWSAPDAATKLAHASALEKVSSGRWHSKQLIHPQNNLQHTAHLENGREINYRANGMHERNLYKIDLVGGTDYQDDSLAKHAERSLVVEDGVRVGAKEISPNERARPPMYMDLDGRKPSVNANDFQPVQTAVKSSGSDIQSQVPLESSERPKLNLLPRSKPLENINVIVDKQQLGDPVHADDVNGLYRPTQPGLAESTPTLERPKLNLKPHSQPMDQFERNNIKSNVVFGGARPREVVLKERGIGDAAASNHGTELFSRAKPDSPKTETASVHASTNHYSAKTDNSKRDKRTAKHADRRENRMDSERPDSQRKNRQSENWRNKREIEKDESQQQGRPPSPETWRKPVEPQNPVSPRAAGPRHGKAASAVELAQAFSISVSDPTAAGQFSSPRGVPGRGQVPFSRLTGPAPRPQINGY